LLVVLPVAGQLGSVASRASTMSSGEIWLRDHPGAAAAPRGDQREDHQLLVDQHRGDAARTDGGADLLDVGAVQDPR